MIGIGGLCLRWFLASQPAVAQERLNGYRIKSGGHVVIGPMPQGVARAGGGVCWIGVLDKIRVKGGKRKRLHAPLKRAGLVNARAVVQSEAMIRTIPQRALFIVTFLAVVAAVSGGVWRYGYHQGLDQLAARGQADLALAGDRLVGQLQRYRDMAVVMADHPVIADTLTQGPVPSTQAVLLGIADKSAALDVLVVDGQGKVLASALGLAPRDLSQYAFVRRALRGALGWGHGAAEPLTRRAFFHAAPVFGPGGRVMGAVMVMTDLNGIDYN